MSTCVSLPVLRRRRYRDAGVPLKSILGVLICLYLLANTGTGTILAGSLLIVAGVPIYLRYRRRNQNL